MVTLHIGIINTILNTLARENINLSTKDKIHLKCDCVDGSVVNGLRQPILFSFMLDKHPGYKVFCEPETIHYKKNESVSQTITFYTENDNHEEVSLNEKTLIFTLKIVKTEFYAQ